MKMLRKVISDLNLSSNKFLLFLVYHPNITLHDITLIVNIIEKALITTKIIKNI